MSNSSVQVTEINRVLTGLNQRLHTLSGGAAVAAVAQAAVDYLPGARWASVTVLREGQFRTLVATAPVAQQADALQHELASGPGVEANLAGTVHLISNLPQEPRWPRFGTRVSQRLGVASLLAYRLPLPEDPATTVGLSLYSDARDAFDGQALWAGGILASHGAMVVSAHLNRQRSGRSAQRPPARS
ncbi:UNVERIFIED_CONTAM: hypothetical protein RF653_18070 [Kocuria sp. CPCC 205316]|uniref:hypothetical protein n=1 Tax=Kocuria TaxID=57493 RepID=UPI0036DAD37B